MISKKVLIFNIQAEYGHFRKINTVTSPLSYSIPTRTALIGFMGAILGIEREKKAGIYPKGIEALNELFSYEKAHIGIQVLKPIKKVNIAFNLVNTAKSFFNIENRTQIEFELLKDCQYRIYFSHEDATIQEELTQRIKDKNHHFSPYMGLSQFTAITEFEQEMQGQWVSLEQFKMIPISSVINMKFLNDNKPIDFDKTFHYITETMPLSLDRVRKASYAEVLLEVSGIKDRIIEANVQRYFQLEGETNILFL